MVGGPESLLDLAAAGQLTAAPTILAGDLPSSTPPGPVVATDSLRRREVAFGELHDNVSATMTRTQPYDSQAPAHDYLPSWAPNWMTTASYLGINAVEASSSAAQARVAGGNRPEHLPFAAVDGDPGTSWWTAPGKPTVGQWLKLDLSEPTTITEMTLRFDVTAPAVPTKVTVVAGIERAAAEFFGNVATVRLPGLHATRSVRVIIDRTIGGGPSATAGISEVEIPGLAAARTLVTPTPPGRSAPDTIVLTAAPTVASCFFVDGLTRCAPGVARGSEDGNRIDRTVTLAAAAAYQVRVWARPQTGLDVNSLLDQMVAAANPDAETPDISASSTAVDDPAGRAGAAIDGHPETAWSPSLDDKQPLLQLSWPSVQEISGLRMTLPAGYPASRPGLIRVIGDDGLRGGFFDGGGTVIFDKPMRTDDLTIMFVDAPTATSVDPFTREETRCPSPSANSPCSLRPTAMQSTPSVDCELPCGSGPTITLGGESVRTRISPTAAELLERREVPAEPCVPDTAASIDLDAGTHRIVAAAGGVADPTRILLATSFPPRRPWRHRWKSRRGRMKHAGLRCLPETRPASWWYGRTPTPAGRQPLDGTTLTPITLDGWQQGWIVPANVAGEIVLTFVPGKLYRMGLVAGAGLLGLLTLLALIPSRRRGVHALAPAIGRIRREGRLVSLVVGAVTLTVVGGAIGALIAGLGAIVVAYRAPLPVSRSARRLSHRVQAYFRRCSCSSAAGCR